MRIEFRIGEEFRGWSPANPGALVSPIKPRALPASQKDFAGGVGISQPEKARGSIVPFGGVWPKKSTAKHGFQWFNPSLAVPFPTGVPSIPWNCIVWISA